MAGDSDKEFERELYRLMVWSRVAGTRAGEMSYEWLAGGTGVIVLNLLLAIGPNGVNFFCNCVFLIAAGGTLLAVRYQRNTGRALRQLSRRLEEYMPDEKRYPHRG